MDKMRSILKGEHPISCRVPKNPIHLFTVVDLMMENQTLRNLLKNLSSFIGDGAGGLLPKLGWDATDFNNFVNRSETDTAWESYQKRKKTQPPSGAGPQGSKRSAEDELPSRSKRSRGLGDTDKDVERGPDFSLLVPLSTPVSTSNMYPPAAGARESGLFSELMRGSGSSPMFMQPSSPASASTPFGGQTSPVDNYQSTYMPPVNVNTETTLPPLAFPPNGTTQANAPRGSNPITPDQGNDEEDPGRGEAYKLVRFAITGSTSHIVRCVDHENLTLAIILKTTREIAPTVSRLPCALP
jgi:hypothetical protein